jgi:toxin ParE1/3/4
MRSGKRIVWSPAAEQDLLDTWSYYARVGSPEIADNLLREIDRGADAVGQNPLLSRDRTELMAGLRSVIVRPHVIFFRIGDDAVEIARVLHGRRDFPTIFAREQ